MGVFGVKIHFGPKKQFSAERKSGHFSVIRASRAGWKNDDVDCGIFVDGFANYGVDDHTEDAV